MNTWTQQTSSPKSTHTFKTAIQKNTAHPHPNKCNSPWCLHSHTLYTFPTQQTWPPWNFYCLPEIQTHLSSMSYQKCISQTALSTHYFRMWWSNWPSLSYITHFIQPEAKSESLNLPSHIKDTKYFLNLIENLPLFPANALLVTADVTPLYTQIQHDGISAVINFMEKQKHLLPSNYLPSYTVHAIRDFILKHSTFNFIDIHIHQILGTSMGTRTALPYANLFMGKE